MTTTTRTRRATKRSRPKPTAEELQKFEDMKARASASGTNLHGVLAEALTGLGDDKLTPAQERVRHEAYITVACAALLVLRDLVTVQAIKLQVSDAPELMGIALRGLMRESGLNDDRAPHAFLAVDWIGLDRFAYIMRFYEAADKLEAADRHKVAADEAIAELKKCGPHQPAQAAR